MLTRGTDDHGLEFREGLRDLGAVVALPVIATERDPVALDVQAVPRCGQPLGDPPGVVAKRRELLALMKSAR